MIRAWVVGTGKITRSNVTAGNIELKGYALYECNPNDDTYKHDW